FDNVFFTLYNYDFAKAEQLQAPLKS
ncbi:MAG: hypothetical protein ACI9WL_001635, partial [Rubritalea sp.]